MQHDGAVLSLAAAPAAEGGSAQLASASADGTLRLWDCGQLLASTSQLGVPGGAQLHACAWVQAGQVATAGGDGRLCLWDSRQLGGAPAAAAAVGAPVLSLAAVAAGGQHLLVAGDQLGRLSVYDPRSFTAPLRRLQPHADSVHALAAAASGEGALVASGADDGGVALLDCARLDEAPRQLVPARREGEAPQRVALPVLFQLLIAFSPLSPSPALLLSRLPSRWPLFTCNQLLACAATSAVQRRTFHKGGNVPHMAVRGGWGGGRGARG